jgi:hypothetical protein
MRTFYQTLTPVNDIDGHLAGNRTNAALSPLSRVLAVSGERAEHR